MSLGITFLLSKKNRFFFLAGCGGFPVIPALWRLRQED
jgi:hypothetical protein